MSLESLKAQHPEFENKKVEETIKPVDKQILENYRKLGEEYKNLFDENREIIHKETFPADVQRLTREVALGHEGFTKRLMIMLESTFFDHEGLTEERITKLCDSFLKQFEHTLKNQYTIDGKNWILENNAKIVL